MTQHAAKEVLQEQILQSFINTALTERPYRMAIFSSTGSGKTKASLDCAKWYMSNVEPGALFIGCHSTIARDIDWPKEVTNWYPEADSMRRYSECYKSLKKYTNYHFAVGIFDEFHYLTAAQQGFFKFNTFGAIIILTATRPRNTEKSKFIDEIVGRNTFILKVDAAIDRGITNDYRIHWWLIKLDDTEKYCTLPYDPIIYTEKEAYLQYCLKLNNIKHPGTKPDGTPIPVNQKYLKMTYAEMMRWMSETKSKRLATKYLADKLRANNRRFVIFCYTKAMCREQSPYNLYSGIPRTDYDRFLNMEIDEIATIRQIQESANLPGVGHGIIMQIDTDPLNMIQKNGRFLRLDPDMVSHLHLPLFAETFDEGWAMKSHKGFDRNKIIKHQLSKDEYWQEVAV